MLQKLLLLASNLPAAFVGGGIFILSLFVLHLAIPLAIVLSVAGYLVTGLLIFPARPALETQRQEMLKTVLKEGSQTIARMRGQAKKVQNAHVKKQVFRICDITEQIFDAVKKNPQNVKSAQQFSVYYLESTEKIVKKYLSLSDHKAYSADVKNSLTKVEKVLTDLEDAFEKQLSQLLSDDVLDLNTELSVLEETIEIEKM